MDGALPKLDDYLADPWLREQAGRERAELERAGQPGSPMAAVRALAGRYRAAQPPRWQALVREQAAALPPMPAATRLVVFLLAENESELIGGCLDAIGADLISSGLGGQAEVVVVRQHRAGAVLDDTGEQVLGWAARHRHRLAVRLIEVEWPADCTAFLSMSRKLAVDITAERALNAQIAAPLYLITEDADVEWIERGRARHVVTTFDVNPGLDILRGWHLRSLDMLEYVPLFVERLTWRACEHALSDPRLRPERNPRYGFTWNRVVTAGWNVAFTLEAYLLAGGYTPTVELFEDMDLGQRISVMRGRHAGGRFVPGTDSAAWMPFEACSDGRRSLAAAMSGGNLYGSEPTVGGFVAATAQMRSWSRAEAAESARTAAPAELTEQLLDRLNAMVETEVPGGPAARRVKDQISSALGVRDVRDVGALRRRQRSFLAAAHDVAAGKSSAGHRTALGRPSC